MASLLGHKLIVVTGKGGTGKSTMACALGLIAAREGLRTLVVEVGDQHHAADLFAGETSATKHLGRFAREHHDGGAETIELQRRLWSTSLNPDRALIEWLQTLAGRITGRMLASSSTFQYFAAAAPGAKELVSMIKVRELCRERHTREPPSEDLPDAGEHREPSYDLVVLDAPATGHALAMLRSPQTFGAIVRVGPLAQQAAQVRQMLENPAHTGYAAVTHATEMAVTETLELEEGLRRTLNRDLNTVIVNSTVPRRFTREELGRIVDCEASLLADRPHATDEDARVLRSVTRTALTVHERARVQQSQIARLRRHRSTQPTPPNILTIPFTFAPQLDLDGVQDISVRLERKL